MKNELLKELVEAVEKQNLKVYNVVVRKDNQIIARHDFKELKQKQLWSVSKTFTSMAAGIAMGEGYFKLNDKVIDFFIDDYKIDVDEHLKKLTIHDLLCMGTGHAECPVVKADWESREKIDICRLFFDEPFVYEPGTHFVYDNSAPYMISRIIGITTGIDLNEFMYQKVFKHMDIEKPFWEPCLFGYPQGFAGLHLDADQVSQFGSLILEKGVWQGKQLIPADYIEKATSIQIKTDEFAPVYVTKDHQRGYGYYMWMNSYPGSYRMDGMYGQYAAMLPDKNTVVTYLSNEQINMTAVLELTWDYLIDKL